MTTEKYLGRMYWLFKTIQSKAELSALERGRATNMVASFDNEPVQTSKTDTLSEIMANVADMDEEIQSYIAEYQEIKAQVETLSGTLAPTYIFKRYGCNQNVNKIAKDLNISRSTAYRIRNEAFKEFEKKYGKIYRKKKNF